MEPNSSPESRKPSRRSSPSGKSGLSPGQLRYHSRGRRRSHEEAQAQSPEAAPEIPDHPLIPKTEPVLIDTQAALADLIDHIRSAGSFAYDTEFIGELSYYPRLCVIQIATTETVALVDPLAGLDLEALWSTVADGDVETIVHAGAQDLEPVFRHTGQGPLNIFDTQIALGFVNLPHPLSLRETVRLLTRTRLAKGSTFTQWDQRPLSQTQLRYAADDVRFLPAIRAEVGDRLEEMGHTDWARQECEALSDPATYTFDALAQCRRIRGARRLNRRQLAAMVELVRWREDEARRQDIPARSLVRDDGLRTLATKGIRSREALRKAAVLPRGVESAHGEAIVSAINAAAAADLEKLPSIRQKDETGPQRQRIDSLWALVQAWCFGRSVHPSLVAGRADIAELILAGAIGEPPRESRLDHGWRKELLGDLLAPFLAGEADIRIGWREDRLRATRSAAGEAESE